MDRYKGPVVLRPALRLCLCCCHRTRLCVRQDKPPWNLPRHLHAACYCGLRHHAMGYRPEPALWRNFPHHDWRISRRSWFPDVGGEQRSWSSRTICVNGVCGHPWNGWWHRIHLVSFRMAEESCQHRLTLCRTYLSTDGPKYPIGHTINLCGQLCVLILAIFGIVYCKWENKQRDLGKRDHRLNATPAQIKDLGYRHPEFRLIH